MSSRLIPVVLAVHARLAGLAGITAAGAQVRLGPVITGDPADAVWVGFDGDPDGEYRAANRTAEWAGLGARKRDEDITVDCAITALLGSGSVADALARIQTLFDLIEDDLRADPSLAITPTPLVAAVDDGSLWMTPTTAGLEPRLMFTVSARTRT